MGKRITTNLLIPILCWFLLISCEEQEPLYDLFPLKVGNEFNYTYSKDRYYPLIVNTRGTESWKVVLLTAQDGYFTYTVERKIFLVTTLLSDTIDVTNDTIFMEVKEKESTTLISFWGFEFKRYQDVPEIELKHEGEPTMPTESCVFKADSGLVFYSYYHPPNQVINQTLRLDSVNFSQ